MFWLWNFANFHSEFLEGPNGPVPYFGPVTEKTLSCEFILFAIQIAIYNKKVIFFWEFLPQSSMKGLGRYYHPPSGLPWAKEPKYENGSSLHPLSSILLTFWVFFSQTSRHFLRKTSSTFKVSFLFDYYYFLWLISLSIFWLICATPLISKNYAGKFF